MSALRSQFLEEGYLVLPALVPDDLCDAVIAAIQEHAGLDPDKEETWYQRDRDGHGIVPLHHHQALWDLRQYEPIHKVFAELYGTNDLFVSNDRVSYKPPFRKEDTAWRREPVHWDCDPWNYNQMQMQGLVYLTDTTEAQGAFSCVPDIYKNLNQYRLDHKDDENRRYPQVSDEDLIQVPGPKGSLVIFHRLMPHTSDLNRSDTFRYVQYVTMGPALEELRDQTIQEWRERLLPDWALTQAVSGGKTREEGPSPRLTDHGRKLVGLDRW